MIIKLNIDYRIFYYFFHVFLLKMLSKIIFILRGQLVIVIAAFF